MIILVIADAAKAIGRHEVAAGGGRRAQEAVERGEDEGGQGHDGSGAAQQVFSDARFN